VDIVVENKPASILPLPIQPLCYLVHTMWTLRQRIFPKQGNLWMVSQGGDGRNKMTFPGRPEGCQVPMTTKAMLIRDKRQILIPLMLLMAGGAVVQHSLGHGGRMMVGRIVRMTLLAAVLKICRVNAECPLEKVKGRVMTLFTLVIK